MNIYVIILIIGLLQETTPNFESDCDNLQVWIGGIQGISDFKSPSPLPFAECHTNLNYDLIWVPNKQFPQDDISPNNLTKYLNGEQNGFKEFKCFAFVIDKVEPTNPENEFHVYDYVFPSDVKVYNKQNDTWRLLLTEKVNNFEELGELKRKTITK